MSEKAKQALLIVVAIVALVGAGFGAVRFFGGEQQEVIATLPHDPNAKSEKQLALEAQAKGQAAPPTETGGERDLSGAVGGG